MAEYLTPSRSTSTAGSRTLDFKSGIKTSRPISTHKHDNKTIARPIEPVFSSTPCRFSGVSPKKIYEKYKEWCSEVGHKAMAKNRVMVEMTERFGEKKKIAGYYYFVGVTFYDSI